MPKIDSGASDVQDFTPPPPGKYLVQIVDIEAKFTNGGDEMWNIELEITQGEHAGKKLFDNMIFSVKAMPRAKMICSRFGLDVNKDFDLKEEMLLNHQAIATVDRIEEYEGQNGIRRNAKIAYAGYEPAPKGQEKGAAKKKVF